MGSNGNGATTRSREVGCHLHYFERPGSKSNLLILGMAMSALGSTEIYCLILAFSDCGTSG